MNENAAIAPLSPGTRLREFTIRGPLGRGGVGIVYAADHEILRATFAVKEFLPGHLACRLAGNRVAAQPGKEDVYHQLRQKFLAEGQTLIQLARPRAHPNLVQVTDAFRENETVYLCMRLEQGKPLDEILESCGTFDEDALRAWLLPLLDGLEHAHGCQIWHRDIKPSNILIRDDGTPILIDFGAARHERPDSAVSVIAQYTPNFAAPEQLFGGAQGPWTDIYSMAATVFQAMTGNSPPLRLAPDWQAQYRHYSPHFLDALAAGLQFDSERRPRSVAQWRRLFEIGQTAAAATVVAPPDADATQLLYATAAMTVAASPADLPTQVDDRARETPSAAIARSPQFAPPQTRSGARRWRALLGGLSMLALSFPIGFQARDWIGANGSGESPTPMLDAPRRVSQLDLAGLECANLALARFDPSGFDPAGFDSPAVPDAGLRLTGYLRDREQLTTLRQRLQTQAPSAVIDTRDLDFAAPFCDLLASLRAVSAASAPLSGLPALRFNREDRHYRDGQYLAFAVASPDLSGGYLSLDVVDSNLDVVHLLPTPAMPNHFIAPGTKIAIGARDDAECARQPDACFIVARPHGNNLVLISWSERTLFSQPRPDQSEPLADYLPALTAALADPDVAGAPRQRIAYRFFTTTD